MFWDHVAGLYNLFETVYNGKVNRQLCLEVAELVNPFDRVLECACGTGMLSKPIGKRCKELIATDYSDGMLRQAKKNCKDLPNVKVYRANIMKLKCKDNSFDKVVAGNVIHLLEDPTAALKELERVCKPGGTIIIPTYINHENKGKPSLLVQILEKTGAGFKRQFTFDSYCAFFDKAGYRDAEFLVIKGKMPCAVALITKKY